MVIRDYKESDMDEIIRIYTNEFVTTEEDIEDLKLAAKILVYDDGGIKGFVKLGFSGERCSMEMCTISDDLIMTVGKELWNEAEKLMTERNIKLIRCTHERAKLKWKQLFDEIGFKYWYTSLSLVYHGEKRPEPDLHVVQYEDKFFDANEKLEAEAFLKLRESNNIKPYNFYLGASKEEVEEFRKENIKNKECIYLFFKDNEILGQCKVIEGAIDIIYVNKKYQGMGYGKQILDFAINRALEQNPEEISLCALGNNKRAIDLYVHAGFEIAQDLDIRKLVITSPYDKADKVMKELFAKDYQFVLSTVNGDRPSSRCVDTYFKDGCFYVVTYRTSNKVNDIEKNPNVSLCFSGYQFSGQAYNIGHPLREENKDLRDELIKVFEPWYFKHNDENDPDMCYLMIKLESGFIYKDGSGYKINFKDKEAKEFPFDFDIVVVN